MVAQTEMDGQAIAMRTRTAARRTGDCPG